MTIQRRATRKLTLLFHTENQNHNQHPPPAQATTDSAQCLPTRHGRRRGKHSDEVGPCPRYDYKLIVEGVNVAVSCVGKYATRLPHRRREDEFFNEDVVSSRHVGK
jgi:hypothetical protein